MELRESRLDEINDNREELEVAQFVRLDTRILSLDRRFDHLASKLLGPQLLLDLSSVDRVFENIFEFAPFHILENHLCSFLELLLRVPELDQSARNLSQLLDVFLHQWLIVSLDLIYLGHHLDLLGHLPKPQCL